MHLNSLVNANIYCLVSLSLVLFYVNLLLVKLLLVGPASSPGITGQVPAQTSESPKLAPLRVKEGAIKANQVVESTKLKVHGFKQNDCQRRRRLIYKIATGDVADLFRPCYLLYNF